MQVNQATIHLTKEALEKAIKDYVAQEFDVDSVSVTFNVSQTSGHQLNPGYGLTGADVKVVLHKRKTDTSFQDQSASQMFGR